MSVDHSTNCHRLSERPVFLDVKAGMTVAVTKSNGWWIGDVIWVDGGARNPKTPTLFQIADVDSGVIRWVNEDEVTHIVSRCSNSSSKSRMMT